MTPEELEEIEARQHFEDHLVRLARDEAILLGKGIPPALVKAIYDPFFYALGLCNGTVIQFSEAKLVGEGWVHLQFTNQDRDEYMLPNEGKCTFDRGIDVRISEIAWVADAPYGS